jgi:hypothetical protein
MVELEFGGDTATDEEEEDEPAPPPKKSSAAAKKSAAKPKPADDEDEDEDEAEGAGSYTREQLEEMALPELKKIAAAMGIEMPPRTRITTYVDRILGEAEKRKRKSQAPTALDIETIVAAVIDAVIEKLQS